MINAFSQRLTPPYSGQAQIAETERARAVSMDGDTWEIHFLYAGGSANKADPQAVNRRFRRVAYVRHADLAEFNADPERNGVKPDERILELTQFLETAALPFKAADKWEYWLLDASDESPLAMIFSCTAGEEMATFPQRTEWNALPAAVMPIDSTEDEKARSDSPVNYRLERRIAARAGNKPYGRWFQRRPSEPDEFPPLMIREDWDSEEDQALCQRYLNRQSSRLLMLHGLEERDRERMERAAKPHAMEVLRFHHLYPEVADNELMSSILVEARLRESSGENDNGMQQRRDGVLYL